MDEAYGIYETIVEDGQKGKVYTRHMMDSYMIDSYIYIKQNIYVCVGACVACMQLQSTPHALVDIRISECM